MESLLNARASSTPLPAEKYGERRENKPTIAQLRDNQVRIMQEIGRLSQQQEQIETLMESINHSVQAVLGYLTGQKRNRAPTPPQKRTTQPVLTTVDQNTQDYVIISEDEDEVEFRIPQEIVKDCLSRACS